MRKEATTELKRKALNIVKDRLNDLFTIDTDNVFEFLDLDDPRVQPTTCDCDIVGEYWGCCPICKKWSGDDTRKDRFEMLGV